ncbi:hypothetical protein N7456_012416 [Penicillium angulare]|uniref:Uncharacterized protein n=1 Tax=Penicillium angulare TaxID=116970 RepID=A0A9W9K102_9EURO|nr:hypothetical protein N7456_012416 [Penicillium angulare]
MTISSPSPGSSYNEETTITQITTIYNLLHKLSYFNRPRDEIFPYSEISYPPADGHTINEELCHELHIAPEVISLMKKIPYPVDGYHKPILWQSRAFEYLHDSAIRDGRDPENADTGDDDDDGLRMDFLKPWEVALTSWMHADDGIIVILNTKSNIIQIIDESVENDFREESEAHHAPTYLQGVIDGIRNLEYIYCPSTSDMGYMLFPESPEQIEIKRLLIEEYGWGTEGFREEDWRREGEGICNRKYGMSL